MTFDETKRLLEAHGLRTLVLRRRRGEGCLLIAPDLSGKIMAVSLDGESGENFGFVNTEAIANRGSDPQFNAYGGALRWWVGPEGGQYGVAFPPGAKTFDLSSWRISEEYNGKRFEILYPKGSEGIAACMGAECHIENASGARFHIGVTCRMRLLDVSYPGAGEKLRRGHRKSEADDFGTAPNATVKRLGYLCETAFENLSDEPMLRQTGLLSIWLLGMYLPSPQTYVIAPFEMNGSGKIVTDTYFSPAGLSPDRLRLNKKEGYLLFRADGKARSKIGLSRSRASQRIGSIDFTRNLLTVWRFPVHRNMPYVNSLWEMQRRPYAGDVTNSYNDDGKIGDFYELECSSPALALRPGERSVFPLEIHHFAGPRSALLPIASRLLERRITYP